jgi:catechol 2,3-dioxygenase-like lactoylglutathione lyase family enzyme
MCIEVRGVCTLLQVFDMPTSVRFYRDVLGFEVLQTSPREGDQLRTEPAALAKRFGSTPRSW